MDSRSATIDEASFFSWLCSFLGVLLSACPTRGEELLPVSFSAGFFGLQRMCSDKRPFLEAHQLS